MKNFKLFGGESIVDFDDYIRTYKKNNPDIEIYVGTDSSQIGNMTSYATAIVFYHPGKGAHVIFSRGKENRVHDIFTRLWKELEYTKTTADKIQSALNIIDEKIVILDLDVNPSEMHGSNVVYSAGVGYLKGFGYKVRTKPNAWSASCAADLLCK